MADVSNRFLRVAFREAPPLTLHDTSCWRTDGNSPVRITSSGSIAFFSSYEPTGHTLRREGDAGLHFDKPAVPVVLRNDPDPTAGKWIETIWQEPAGPWHGWYHAEERAEGSAKLFVPHIGRATSTDEGRNWDCRGEVLRLPRTLAARGWENGFFAGGYGDLSAVVDRTGEMLYLFFTSYHPDAAKQGVCVMRQAVGDLAGPPEPWTLGGWSRDAEQPLLPILPMRRAWRHSDPDGFWGPALHYNRALRAYVMLLNRTAGGAGDLVQEGIYASLNASLADPEGWSAPLRIVDGGGWYPQVIGLEAGGGDHEAGAFGRFFMAGFSAWQIDIGKPHVSAASPVQMPLACSRQDFARLFGVDRRCPW